MRTVRSVFFFLQHYGSHAAHVSYERLFTRCICAHTLNEAGEPEVRLVFFFIFFLQPTMAATQHI